MSEGGWNETPGRAAAESGVLRSLFTTAVCLLMTVAPLAIWHDTLGQTGLFVFAVSYGVFFLIARLGGGIFSGRGRMVFSLTGTVSSICLLVLFDELPGADPAASMALLLWPLVAGSWNGDADGDALSAISWRGMLQRWRAHARAEQARRAARQGEVNHDGA